MRHSLYAVFYDQAEAHEAAGRYEDALALYYQAHRWAPADAGLWLRLGVLSFLMTDAEWLRRAGHEGTHMADMGALNADVYLERAARLDPDLAQARFWRGWVRLRLFADEAGAQSELEAALERSPRLAYAHAAMARLELARDDGDPAAAVPMLERAIAALPESPRLHYDLGACHARLEQADAARAAFRRAMNAGVLAVPAGPGGRHLADEFHGEPMAIAGLVMRFYSDMMT